jgi:hypothetical protein
MTTAWLVLCPAARYVEPEVEDFLQQMQRAGVSVFRAIGSSDIARVRSTLGSWVLEGRFGAVERVLWVDSDQPMTVATAARLLKSDLAFITAIAPARMEDRLLIDLAGPLDELVLGEGEPFEIRRCGFGAVVTSRATLEAVRGPMEAVQGGWWPLFLPYVSAEGEYLSEDYAFCERARAAGVKLYADPQAPSAHITRRVRTWDDCSNFRGQPHVRLAKAPAMQPPGDGGAQSK